MKELTFYTLFDTPKNRKHIETRWVFNGKENEKGNIVKFKSRWVVKGYLHSHGVCYDLTHSSVSRMSTLRMDLSLAVKLKL